MFFTDAPCSGIVTSLLSIFSQYKAIQQYLATKPESVITVLGCALCSSLEAGLCSVLLGPTLPLLPQPPLRVSACMDSLEEEYDRDYPQSLLLNVLRNAIEQNRFAAFL